MKKQLKLNTLILIMAAMICFSGCASLGRSFLGKATTPVIDTAINKIMDMKSAQLAREGLPTAVLLVATLAEVAGDNRNALSQATFLYVALGLCVEDENKEYASVLYNTGYEYGLRALKTNRTFRKGIEKGKTVTEMVGVLDRKYTGTLMWTALAAGLNAMLNMDDPTSMMVLAPCIAMVKRSIALDENYYDGLGNLFMAAYASVMPELLDASCGPEQSKILFDMVRKNNNGHFLFVDLFEARYLVSLHNDREKFKALLDNVIATDSGVLKGMQMLNEIAKMKAAYSLSHMEKYF
ncbi:MAG: TRAP transporter TatT component family protein [Proteobacteria bacterium]|nr:TRAP transporter TatT component family protein [Pseudomonadota bacterium]